jgi:hypothetical protein
MKQVRGKLLISLSLAVGLVLVVSGCRTGKSEAKACCGGRSAESSKAAAAQPAAASESGHAAAETPAVPVKLKVVKVDSEETAGEDGKAANAVDGDPETFWHTQWQDGNPEPPHEIVIELSPASTIKGFTYLPRQDESENGTIKDYELYVSNDGQDFGQPVCKGTFENSKEKKTAGFAPVTCRFIKLKAISEVNDGAWTTAAEIGVVR